MNNLVKLAERFEQLCVQADLHKVSFIRRMPKGYWGVYSHKGKLLGKYKTKADAQKRLRQIEFFKHRKASHDDEVTYTSMLRKLNKQFDPEVVHEFRSIFKHTFDQALIDQQPHPESIALEQAMQFVDGLGNDAQAAHFAAFDHLAKYAGTELGDPVSVGKYLAALIHFILRRISNENRSKVVHNVRNRLYALNEVELASKRMPASSSIGQCLTIVKHLLFGKSPQYVRQVLNSIAGSL